MAVVCFCVYFTLQFDFSQQIKNTGIDIDMQQPDVTNLDTILERYIEESKKLKDEFTPVWERLRQETFITGKHGSRDVDIKKWETEYYRPLFEKSRQAMIRITGRDDYLALWKNQIPQQIFQTIGQEELRSLEIPIGNYLPRDYSI